jgi:hypothetical protein
MFGMHFGTFFDSWRRDDDGSTTLPMPMPMPRARRARRHNWLTSTGPSSIPNRKLMLRMLCFPKKPLYAHHLPVLDLLALA